MCTGVITFFDIICTLNTAQSPMGWILAGPIIKIKTKEARVRGLKFFKAEIAEKYGAPVYSQHLPITAIFPG